MNKQREAKAAAVAELKEKLGSSIVTILADYRGMNVQEMTQLRRKLREAGVEFKVVKNTLTRRAAQELGLEGLDAFLEGPTAAAFSLNDPAAPAKILMEVMRNSKTFQIKAGVLQGRVIGQDEIKALADLPSREELLAKVVGGFQAPLAGLVNVLAGNIRNLVYVLEAVRKKKEEAA
ncbi:MAG: 50S ribosomal protein L10 [Moorella humiferrea]|uniref:Large ribosomal subunit protein uL10 n=1 Tax=Neomoorella humiferrea TaxID=676965 RepID=A0A2T0AL67_9FIRM|nr:50S ribosomal protein L10 [Moorella humiferrea]MBE3572467.1 50S ribosomal protein L10 [Moorella humiferrea]PRR69341.1 50S ribosomal protein L10 [Moorella humiferrea]